MVSSWAVPCVSEHQPVAVGRVNSCGIQHLGGHLAQEQTGAAVK